MQRFLDRLVSRRTSIALIALVACVAVVGAVIPQRPSTAPAEFAEWTAANPGIAGLAAVLGLDDVFSAWWFLGLLAIFAFALAVATWRMVSALLRSTRGIPAAPKTPLPGVELEVMRRRALSEGYRVRSANAELLVFEKHSLGAWGAAVLHAGMVITVVAGLIASGGTSRAVMDLSVGELRSPGDQYLSVENGAFGTEPEIGRPLRLDGIATTTWPNGELRSMTATVAVMNADGTWETHTGSADTPLLLHGHTIYLQAGEFGDAAFLEIADPAEPEPARRRMEFLFTQPGAQSYSDVLVGERAIEGRWDPQMIRGEKPLALRIAGEDAAEPVLLAEGETGEVGSFKVTYADSGQWARLIVVKPRAIEALFAGFGIIAIGSLMLYLWVPRRLVIAEDEAGLRYRWVPTRMSAAFEDERDRILGLGVPGEDR